MRITTAFSWILRLPGASVHEIAFTDHGLVIALRRRRRRLLCFRNLNALTAAIYLCLGGVTIQLPTET